MSAYFSNDRERFGTLGQSTKSAKELVKIAILEAWYNVEEAIERFDIQDGGGRESGVELNIVRARLRRLIRILHAHLKQQVNNKKLTPMLEKAEDGGEEELFELQEYIYDFLHAIGLTKLQMENVYDKADPLAEDQAKGLG